MDEERKKYIERWWLKYEAMANLDADFPPSREVFFELVNSVYRHSLKSGKTSAHIEGDMQHHVAMQQLFKKMAANQ